MTDRAPVIRLRDLVKRYQTGDQSFNALDGVSLDIFEGEYVSIMGASGSGKSTLMNILGCLDRPTSGEVEIDGVSISRYTDDDLARIRNKKIGFVFQQFNLLPRATAVENVELPMIYARVAPAQRRERALRALAWVGLEHRSEHRPTELSGGQQQRVAIARALVNEPSVLLADEPTGALDSRTTGEIMDLFTQLNTQGTTLVVVTHDPDVALYAHRLIRVRDGRILRGNQAEDDASAKAEGRALG